MFRANSKTERRSICHIDWSTVKLACEQALLFGWAQHAAREAQVSGKAARGRRLGLFSPPPPCVRVSSRVSLVRLLLTISPKWRGSSQATVKQNMMLCKSKINKNTLRNGPDKNDSNNGNEHVGMQKRVLTFLLSVLTSDWLKQQKLTNFIKQYIYSSLLSNHLPYNKIWSQFE